MLEANPSARGDFAGNSRETFRSDFIGISLSFAISEKNKSDKP
jgi:hypothetical protein